MKIQHLNYDETNLSDDPGKKKCLFRYGGQVSRLDYEFQQGKHVRHVLFCSRRRTTANIDKCMQLHMKHFLVDMYNICFLFFPACSSQWCLLDLNKLDTLLESVDCPHCQSQSSLRTSTSDAKRMVFALILELSCC